MRVRIDRERCTGVASCVSIAPTVFHLDGEHKAVVDDPGTVSEEALWEAAESCPMDAVILEDDEGRQLHP